MNVFELAVIVSAVDKATTVLNGVKNAINGAAAAAEKMKVWGQQASVGGAMMQGSSQQIIGALENIVTPAQEVETALSQVAVALGDAASTEALARVQSAGVAWSKIHKDTAKQYIDATNTMAQAGLNEAQALAGSNVALAVATATMGDGVKAADLLATLYNNVADKTKDAASEMGRLGDIVTKTQNVFQIKDLQQFSEGLKFAVPSAQAMGVSIEEVSAVIGTLNNAGLQGSMAGTAFSSTMAQMLKASKELRFEIARTAKGGVDFTGTIKNLEKQFGALDKWPPQLVQSFQKTFGDEGFRGIALMVGKSKDLESSLKGIQDATGATAKAQAILEGTSVAGLQVLKNHWAALKIEIGQNLVPTIKDLGPRVIGAITAMGQFAKAHPDLIKTAILIAAVVGAVLAVVGPVTLAIGSVITFGGYLVQGASVLSSFTMGIIGLVPRIAAASVAMYQFAAGAVVRMGAALMGCVPSFLAATASAWGFAAALMANPITWIVLAIVAAAALIYIYWEPIKKFFVAMWDVIKAAFVAAWQSCVNAWQGAVAWFSGLWEAIKSAFVGAWNGVVGFVGGIWNTITVAFDGGIMGVLGLFAKFSPLGLIVQALDAVTNWLFGFSLVDAGANILGTLTQGILNAASGPVNAVMGVVQRIRNLLPFSPAKAGPLRDLHRVRLIETIAETVRPARLVAAVSGAAAMAVATVPAAVSEQSSIVAAAPAAQARHQALAVTRMADMPSVLPMPAANARDSGGNTGTSEPILVQFNIAGNADATTVSQLERWAKDNAKLLYSVVKRQGELEKRSEFG